MKKLLIVVNDPDLGISLVRCAQESFCVEICHNGIEAIALLESFRPDALVLGLKLAYVDGLEVLRRSAAFLPPVILVLSTYTTPYIEYSISSLGVSYMMLLPVRIPAVIANIQDMLSFSGKPQVRSIIHGHLLNLNIPTQRAGFSQLEIGIALYAEDPDQSLSYELYPSIAKACNKTGGKQIERAISEVINNAWQRRDNQIWERYFPGCSAEDALRPSNKKFIAKIASML